MKSIQLQLSIFLFIFLSKPILTQAQISGTVSDKKGKTLDYVLLTLYRYQNQDSVKKTALFSELDGKYIFKDLDSGKYLLKASYMGYSDFKSNYIFIDADKKGKVINVQLEENANQLKEVSITSKKPSIERKADRLIFNVEGNAAAAGSPLLDVLRMVPGISVINEKLNIRGKEGLIVMIDNRRTYMTGDELLSYLKNTPAESIAQLEIITNPSAKYDAEGNVGIVHIKTKRSTVTGTTGTVSQTLGYGKYLKSTTGGQLAYTGEKLSLFGNSYLSYDKSEDNYFSRTSLSNADQLVSNNHNVKNNKNSYSYQGGFEYRLNSNSSFGAVVDGSLRPDYQSNGNSNVEKTGTEPQYVLTNNTSNTNNKNYSSNLHYYWNNDKNTDQFSADVNYVNYDFNLKSNLIDTYYANASDVSEAAGREEQLRNRSIRKVDVFAGKADYTHKWNDKHSLESGLKWSRVKTNSDLVYEQLKGSEWQNDPGRTNQYLFRENIYAGYLNYNGQFGKLNLQTGLRAEQTSNNGYSQTLNSTVKRNYLKFFPSIFLSSTFAKDHSWSTSYSYRIDRPTYSNLNPFTFINNPYNYFRGNPYLRPQYTHNLEANYDFKKKLFVSLSYQRTQDMISEITEIGSSPDIIGGTRANLNKMDSYSVTVNAPFELFKGWDVNLYVGGFNNTIKDAKGYSNKQTTFTASFNTSINLPAGIIVDANGNYQSAMSYGTILLDPMYGFNAGVKRAFLDKKLNVRLNISDLFNLQKMTYNSSYANINTYGLNTFESRVVRLSASYKFGKVKALKQRKTGAEEEQSRARY